MRIENTVEVDAPLDRVWALVNDIPRVAPCMPGAALTGVHDDQTYEGTVAVKLGPLRMSYKGKVVVEEVDEANHSARLAASGKDVKGAGTARASVETRLEPVGDTHTRLQVTSDVQLTGKVASFGRGGAINDVASRLFGQFADCLRATLEAETAATDTAAADAGTPATAATGTAVPGGGGTAAPADTGIAVPGGGGTAAPADTGIAVPGGGGTAAPAGGGTAVPAGGGTSVPAGGGAATGNPTALGPAGITPPDAAAQTAAGSPTAAAAAETTSGPPGPTAASSPGGTSASAAPATQGGAASRPVTPPVRAPEALDAGSLVGTVIKGRLQALFQAIAGFFRRLLGRRSQT